MAAAGKETGHRSPKADDTTDSFAESNALAFIGGIAAHIDTDLGNNSIYSDLAVGAGSVDDTLNTSVYDPAMAGMLDAALRKTTVEDSSYDKEREHGLIAPQRLRSAFIDGRLVFDNGSLFANNDDDAAPK